MKIAISEVKINSGRQETSVSGINELARSISEVGLLNPITVDPNHTLIAGLHRLEAAKLSRLELKNRKPWQFYSHLIKLSLWTNMNRNKSRGKHHESQNGIKNFWSVLRH